jgi:hypothetical protein
MSDGSKPCCYNQFSVSESHLKQFKPMLLAYYIYIKLNKYWMCIEYEYVSGIYGTDTYGICHVTYLIILIDIEER